MVDLLFLLANIQNLKLCLIEILKLRKGCLSLRFEKEIRKVMEDIDDSMTQNYSSKLVPLCHFLYWKNSNRDQFSHI